MKKIIAVIIILYSLIYYFYPAQSNYRLAGQIKEYKDNPSINLVYENGNIVLDNFKEDDNERFWGSLNNYQYMVYKDINKYIYVDGEFFEVNAKWENGNYKISEEDVLELFKLKGENGKYIPLEVASNICKDIVKEDVLKILGNPNIPIENAFITKQEGQLPGASRDYRNGKHEGFDWYTGAIGTEISRKTKVHPIFEGRIVRIDKEFKELEPDYRNSLLEEAAENKNTSQATLDKLRGRQIWVQSKDGILVHYAHLSSVNKELNVGDQVKKNDWIGKVGNSGTSNGALETDEDLHLHSDILVCGKNFWEYGKINEMNNSLIDIFDEKTINKNTREEKGEVN